MFPVSPGCRMTKSYHHPVCNLVHSVFCPIIGRFSQINWEFDSSLDGVNVETLQKNFWEFWMWMLFHVEDYLILPISCGIGRMERWIIQVLTVHRIILHIRNGRMLQSGLATDRIRGSTAAVLFVEFSRKRFQEAQSAKLNYFLCFIYLLLALSFASFFGYLFTQIN